MIYIAIALNVVIGTIATFVITSWIEGLQTAINLWRTIIIMAFLFGVITAHILGISYAINVPICTLTTIITHVLLTVASRHFIGGNHR